MSEEPGGCPAWVVGKGVRATPARRKVRCSDFHASVMYNTHTLGQAKRLPFGEGLGRLTLPSLAAAYLV